MIAEFLNRDVVLDELRKVEAETQRHLAALKAGGAQKKDADSELLLTEVTAAAGREAARSSGQEGFNPPAAQRRGEATAPIDDFAFLSHDPIVSLLQTTLERYVEEKRPDLIIDGSPADDERRSDDEPSMVTSRRLVESPVRTDDGRRIFNKFSITDAGWVRSKLAEAIKLFRGPHAFVDRAAPAVTLKERSRLVLVGDWGSGLPRAQKVAKQIRKVLAEGKATDVEQHVVHLGDVYYSGYAKEYRQRFLPYWPVDLEDTDLIRSWSLNSNHDMYSGGYGYYDLLLQDPRFRSQQGSSYFSLRHPNWQIIGLDTAWEEGRLHGGQLGYLEELLRDSKRKALLLSHHQPFSAYESSGGPLLAQVSPVLDSTPVKAWFWGHEHRCVLYDSYENVEFGRCVGHGGVPVYMWHDEKDSYPVPANYEYRAYYKRGLERWAVFGFAVLDFNGPDIHVRYIDENGRVHREEDIH